MLVPEALVSTLPAPAGQGRAHRSAAEAYGDVPKERVMTIRFELADVGVDGFLSSLLHDSWCSWSDDSVFDGSRSVVVVDIERIRYEEPRSRRFLGLIGLTRFQTVPAELVVSDVHTITLKPEREHRRYYCFSHAERDGMCLRLCFEGATIAAELHRWAPITLRDVGEPSRKPRHTWFGNWNRLIDAVNEGMKRRRFEV